MADLLMQGQQLIRGQQEIAQVLAQRHQQFTQLTAQLIGNLMKEKYDFSCKLHLFVIKTFREFGISMDSNQIQARSSWISKWSSTQLCYAIVFKHIHLDTQFHINSRFHTQTRISFSCT